MLASPLPTSRPQSTASLTSRERHNPPPRQKSCTACIKAKRRCEPGVPACVRCAERGMACEMPVRRGRRISAAVTSASRSRTGLSVGSALGDTCIAADAESAQPAISGTSDISIQPAGVPPQVPETLTDALSQSLPLFLSADTDMPSLSLYETTPSCQHFDDRSFLFPGGLPCPTAEIDMPTLGDDPELSPYPWSLDSLDEPQTPNDLIRQPPRSVTHTPTPMQPGAELDGLLDAVAKRLRFGIEEIRRTPSTMVHFMETPWCHRKLYVGGMPRSMQDALTCSGLYLTKNHINAPVILSTIGARAKDLSKETIPNTPRECLAHIHAVILYHIIFIFDKSITSRATADMTQAALVAAAAKLAPHVQFDVADSYKSAVDLPLHPLAPTKAFWEEWILQESCRRTMVFAYFLLQAYRVIAGLPTARCDGRLGLWNVVTLSAYLWYADSPITFARAWRERKHLVVTNLDFSSAFREAGADDLEVMGAILLTSIIGIDEMEGWFASKGSSLKHVRRAGS